jgi:ABC-type sugar transport system permease subunit
VGMARSLPRISLPGDSAAWLRAITVWQLLVAVGAAAALTLFVVAAPEDTSGLARTAVLVVTAFMAGAAGASVVLLRRRHHLGRSLAVAVNYLGFIACTLALLQHNRFFVGVDALGTTFRRVGVWFVPLLVLGYLLASIGTRPDRPAPLRRWGLGLMAIAGVGFLLTPQALGGIATFAARTVRPSGLILLVGAIVFGVVCRVLWRDDMARLLGGTTAQSETLNGLLFVSPNLLGFIAFFAGPLLFSLFVSFNEWDAFGTKNFIGLGNYARVLSLDFSFIDSGQSAGEVLKSGYVELTRFGNLVVGARDKLFWISIRNIVLFSAIALPATVIPALFLSTLLNAKAPGIKFFRAIYFIPSVAGVVGIALIWKQLLNATVGYLNYAITQVVNTINVLPGITVTDPRLQWLSDADIALFSMVIIFVYQYLGFSTVLFLAGLQGVSADLYEAAMLDGANRWQRFRNITLPQLAPTTFFVVATTGINALQLFAEPVVLFSNFTPPGSGPNNAALTPVGYLYQQGFQRFAQGYASAVAWVLFLLIFAFTFVQFQRQRAQADG